MKLYNTTTRCNFESHVRSDINSLGLVSETFAHLLPAFKEFGEVLGVTSDEYFTVYDESDLQNDQLFGIEYFTPKIAIAVCPYLTTRRYAENLTTLQSMATRRSARQGMTYQSRRKRNMWCVSRSSKYIR